MKKFYRLTAARLSPWADDVTEKLANVSLSSEEPAEPAAGKALDRAGFGLVAGSLKDCLASGHSEDLDSGKLEKLFLSLA